VAPPRLFERCMRRPTRATASASSTTPHPPGAPERRGRARMDDACHRPSDAAVGGGPRTHTWRRGPRSVREALRSVTALSRTRPKARVKDPPIQERITGFWDLVAPNYESVENVALPEGGWRPATAGLCHRSGRPRARSAQSPTAAAPQAHGRPRPGRGHPVGGLCASPPPRPGGSRFARATCAAPDGAQQSRPRSRSA